MKAYNRVEPLEYLLSKYSFDINNVERISTGEKYTAVMLKNGNIGVCANLGHTVNPDKLNYLSADPENISHRIVVNAYFNALLNYSDKTESEADVFDLIDFRKYNFVVMLGYIRPIVERFRNEDIPLTIFDLQKDDPCVAPYDEQKEILKVADAVLLTSTSVSNGTFTPSIDITKDDCEIFMIGPSSIMTPEMFEYRNIRMIFGSVFGNNDEEVMDIISDDGGTRRFLKKQNKKVVSRLSFEDTK
jgi:uncharacterized protein (DUF4213/DUF364 family)